MSDHELRAEIAFWRDILTKVAQDLERTACSEKDAARKDWLERRAMRIRQRLHEGMPDGYVADPLAQRMNPLT